MYKKNKEKLARSIFIVLMFFTVDVLNRRIFYSRCLAVSILCIAHTYLAAIKNSSLSAGFELK